MKEIKLAIASDHAGFQLKEKLKSFLIDEGYEVKDLGTNSEESVDYPDFGHPLADTIERGDCDFGIAICGSGNGINMTVNKYMGIRSALCWNKEIAILARAHNNANICAIPGRFLDIEEASVIVTTFFNTGFEGGRHERRIKKITAMKI